MGLFKFIRDYLARLEVEAAAKAKVEEEQRRKKQEQNYEIEQKSVIILKSQPFLIEDEYTKRHIHSDVWVRLPVDKEKALLKFNDILCHSFSSCFIVDSNVWMHAATGTLFTILASFCGQNNITFTMPVEQYDEIINIKRNKEHEKGERVNLAFQRIEWFIKTGIMTIDNMGITSNPNAYADAYILKLFIEKSKKGIVPTILTLDRDLRIRLRGIDDIECTIVDMPQDIFDAYGFHGCDYTHHYSYDSGDYIDWNLEFYYKDKENETHHNCNYTDELDDVKYESVIDAVIDILNNPACKQDLQNEVWVSKLQTHPYRDLFASSPF